MTIMVNLLKFVLTVYVASSAVVGVSTLKKDTDVEEHKQNGLPRIVKPPVDQTVMENSAVQFTCIVEASNTSTIEWSKNQRKIRERNRFIIMAIPGGSLLRLEAVRSRSDGSVFECMVVNQDERSITIAGAQLKVIKREDQPNGFPKIEGSSSITAVNLGRHAEMRCSVTGSPTPTVSWLKDMLPVNKDNPRYSFYEGDSILKIFNSTGEDQGRYECIANNSVGTALFLIGNLYVRQRRVSPMFTIPPEEVYDILSGDTVELSCIAVGSPMPLVKWKKGNEDLTQGQIGRSLLVLENVTESGNYTCQAVSSLGSKEAHTQVLVRSLPRVPTNLQASAVTETTVHLIWNYEGDSERYYTIVYKSVHDDGNNHAISGITSTHYNVTGLFPSTTYEFSVAASNSMGNGPRSQAIVVVTEGRTGAAGTPLPQAPSNLWVKRITSTSVDLTWEYNEDSVEYYVIQYKLQLEEGSYNEILGINTTYYKVTHLLPYTMYEFNVVATNKMGRGPRSRSLNILTDASNSTDETVRLIKSLEINDEDHAVVKITCRVLGDPVPLITWTCLERSLPTSAVQSTTVQDGDVISTLTLTRNAFVYSQYKCEATNGFESDTRIIKLPYNGNHPPVSLEKIIMSLSTDIRKIKEDLEIVKNAVVQ